nr:inversin-B-like [Procambarus clarkii]
MGVTQGSERHPRHLRTQQRKTRNTASVKEQPVTPPYQRSVAAVLLLLVMPYMLLDPALALPAPAHLRSASKTPADPASATTTPSAVGSASPEPAAHHSTEPQRIGNEYDHWGGWTKLHSAAIDGNNTWVEELISEGANISAVTDSGETPLYYARKEGHRQVVETLLKWNADDWTDLHKAAYHGDKSQVEALLAKEADIINATTVTNETSLLLAVQEDHVAVAEALIHRHADINIADLKGKTTYYVNLADLMGKLEYQCKRDDNFLDPHVFPK